MNTPKERFTIEDDPAEASELHHLAVPAAGCRSDSAVLAALDFSALCEHGNHKRGVLRPPAQFWCARRCGCPGFLLCEQCLSWERAAFRWVMEGCDGELAPQRWLRCRHCPRRGGTFDDLIEVVTL